jgi:hypothetical protein
MNSIKIKQLNLYTDLKFELKRLPLSEELERKCIENNISYRLGTKYGFENFEKLKKDAELHNHRVVSIEEDGVENVYNGTVDEFHNFFIGGFEGVQNNGKLKYCYINNLNCGEITLSGYDSCRLMVINLLSFIKNEFTDKAKFDYIKFSEIVQKAQRLMDDMIDIEIEQVDKIINKIKADPEDDTIKKIEIDLWENIKTVCINGRRTGLGITALGDTIAALNVIYGSEESIQITEKIYKTLAVNSEKSSCILAKERGAFPVFDRKLEKGHVFIERLLNSDEELKELYNKYGRRNISTTTTAPVRIN